MKCEGRGTRSAARLAFQGILIALRNASSTESSRIVNRAEEDAIMSTTHSITTPRKQGWRPGRQRRSPILLVLALLAFAPLFMFLSGCDTPGSHANAANTPETPPVQQVLMHLAPVTAFSTSVRIAQRHLYPFSQSNVGLMQPAVDAQGNIWVGEMHSNRLGRLNSHTGVVTSWEPPGARYGIMTTTIDAQGNVWFTEQNANYIGRFDPGHRTFRIFPLGNVNGSPLGPQDLRFDSRGMLWFTAATAGAIGRLDPTTGAIRIWLIPSPSSTIPSSPYSFTVTPAGRVWFGEFADGVIGTLDPSTGQVILYDLPDPQAQVFSMATDSAGHLWFTEVLPGKLSMFDPETDTLKELAVPAASGKQPALYELAIDHQGQIWFVDVGAGALVRYMPQQHSLTFFQLSLLSSAPFGLALDPTGNIWFTAGGSPANYIGEMAPGGK
jgi:virginiamycin B lyase